MRPLVVPVSPIVSSRRIASSLPTGLAVALLLLTCGVSLGRAQSQAPPSDEWRATKDRTLRLSIDGKHQEVLTIYESYVAKYPGFAEAQGMLGGAYEQLARQPANGPRRKELLEKAAVHIERSYQLWKGDGAWVPVRALIDIYGPAPLGLDRPARQREVMLDAPKRFPAEPGAYQDCLRLLALEDQTQEVKTVIRAARQSIPKTIFAQVELSEMLWQVATTDGMETGISAMVADESVAVINEFAATHPRDRQALEAKIRILREQADNSAPERGKPLRAEADRADAALKKLLSSRPSGD